MKIILLLVLMLGGCASWRGPAAKTLNIAHNSVRMARLQAGLICKPAIMGCIERRENPCAALEKCFALRRKLLLVLESTETAIKLGYESLSASISDGGKEVALSAVAIATANARDVMVLVAKIKEEF